MSALASLKDILSTFYALPPVSQRAVSSIVGAAVADAATRPTHWVYKEEDLFAATKDSNPAFWPTNLSPFYKLPTGRRSCYSDESICMLQSLPSSKAISSVVFDKTAVQDCLSNMFAPGSEYDQALQRRKEAYDPAKKLEKKVPVDGPWQQSAVTHFLTSLANNDPVTGAPKSSETDGLCLSLPLIAQISTFDEKLVDFDGLITESISTLISEEMGVKFSLISSKILQEIIKTQEIDDNKNFMDVIDKIVLGFKDDQVTQEWEEVKVELGSLDQNLIQSSEFLLDETNFISNSLVVNSINKFGKACPYPGNFKSVLIALCSSRSFSEGVRRNIMGGGCNCSRANFLGACMGAVYGIGGEKGIPLDWIEKTDIGKEVLIMAIEKLAK